MEKNVKSGMQVSVNAINQEHSSDMYFLILKKGRLCESMRQVRVQKYVCIYS